MGVPPGNAAQTAEITELLLAWRNGDRAALERLVPLIYQELRWLARRSLGRQPSEASLQATALVNEAYLRLVNLNSVTWQDRAHFFAVSAQVMRWILLDRARARASELRHVPPAAGTMDLDLVADPGSRRGAELIAVDDALQALSKIDPRRARVVEMRFFGGLQHEEIAAVLQVSSQTVMRDWRLARAWLLREIQRGGAAE